MPTIREIKRRIRSVQSTSKITKAMEMVATSKMKRAQERTLASRPYAEKMRIVLADLAAQRQPGEDPDPLLAQRPVTKVELIHITPDRGLCGGLIANINRQGASFVLEQATPVTIISLGRKGRDFMMRTGQDIRAAFIRLSDNPSVSDILPTARIVTEDYSNALVDAVYLSYTQFVSTMTQRPMLRKLLPIEPLPEAGHGIEYIYEPSPAGVLSQLLPRFVEMQIYHALLESLASEHSARMVAMRNATDNAHDLIDELTLTHNKLRQEIITKELMDITGGAAALD